MADNVPITAGVGTDIATDDIGGKHHQRVKVVWGTDGTANDADTATGKPLPVQLRGSDGTDVSNGLPVTGTFFQATQPVSGTFFQATQPVSATALPLPAGAATLAKQPALGTAGVASADVITVQGVASMTPLKMDGSGVTQPVSGTVSATQSGTWTVQPGNTANTTAWKVDASSVAVPVTDNSGSLTVDAPVATPVFVRMSDGASAVAVATAAKQPALGTAGSPSADVLSVQFSRTLTQQMVNIAASGDNTIVALTGGQNIKLYRLILVAASTVTVTFKGGVNLTGPFTLIAGVPLVLAYTGDVWIDFGVGAAFIITLSGSVQVTGISEYVKA